VVVAVEGCRTFRELLSEGDAGEARSATIAGLPVPRDVESGKGVKAYAAAPVRLTGQFALRTQGVPVLVLWTTSDPG
jgi:hypothetical protein